MVSKSNVILIVIIVTVILALVIILALYFTHTPPFRLEFQPPDNAVIYGD
jgi:flagellar basal body-associated protein FliL